MFRPFGLHSEFLDSDGSAEGVTKLFPVIRFGQIGECSLLQRSHRAIRRDMGGHNHDRERGVQAVGFSQDVKAITVRQAQVEDDGVEPTGSNEFDGAGDGTDNGDGVAIMVQEIL